MLVWQGFGFLAVIIPIVSYVLTVKVAQAALGAIYMDSHSWPGALGTLLGAVIVWFMAQKLKGPGRTLVDPKTGQTVVLTKKHTVFFVPMHYVAVIMAVVAVGMLIFKQGSPL
jgi:hypothetical protein